jgi:hypothetical protein
MSISSLTEKEREVVLQLVGLFWGSSSVSKNRQNEFEEEVENLVKRLYRERDADESLDSTSE